MIPLRNVALLPVLVLTMIIVLVVVYCDDRGDIRDIDAEDLKSILLGLVHDVDAMKQSVSQLEHSNTDKTKPGKVYLDGLNGGRGAADPRENEVENEIWGALAKVQLMETRMKVMERISTNIFKEMQDMRRDKERLKKTAAEAMDDIQKLVNKINAVENSSKSQMEERFAEIRGKIRDASILSNQTDQTRRQNADQNNVITTEETIIVLKSEVESLKLLNQVMQSIVFDTQNEINLRMYDSVFVLRNKTANLEKQLCISEEATNSDRRLGTFCNRMKNSEQDVVQLTNSLAQQGFQLEQLGSEMYSEVGKLKTAVEELQDQGSFTSVSDTSPQTMHDMSQFRATVDEMEEQIRNINSDVTLVQINQQTIDHTLSRHDDDIGNIYEEMRETTERLDNLKHLQNYNENNMRGNRMEGVDDEMRKRMNEISGLKDELDAVKTSVDSLHNFDAAVNQTIKMLESHVESIREKVSVVEEKVYENMDNITLLADKFKEVADTDKYDSQINSQRKAMSHLSSYLWAIRKQTNKLESEANEQKVEIVEMNDKLNDLKQIDYRIQQLETNNTDGRLIWRINGYREKLQDAASQGSSEYLLSEFFTYRGYVLQGGIYLNGFGVGLDDHMSVFLHLARGDLDDDLSWPFRQMVEFVLLDQTGAGDHVSKQINTANSKCSDAVFARPVNDVGSGCGIHKFVPHESVENNKYLIYDTIYLKIEIH